MCLSRGLASSQVPTGAYPEPGSSPHYPTCAFSLHHLSLASAGREPPAASLALPKGGETSFSLWTATWGPGWRDTAVSGSWPFLPAPPWGAHLLPVLPPPTSAWGRERPLGEAPFCPRAASVPTTAQDVSRSSSLRDSTRSTEGRRRACREAAVVQAGFSLLLMTHFPALI